MSTLHTVPRSPFRDTALESCLRVARAGSALLLLEDGVYAALAGTAVEPLVRGALERLDVFVLAPDLAARGFADAPLIEGVTRVDHAGFVDLAVNHERVQGWP